jgi:putative serine protease PepD
MTEQPRNPEFVHPNSDDAYNSMWSQRSYPEQGEQRGTDNLAGGGMPPVFPPPQGIAPQPERPHRKRYAAVAAIAMVGALVGGTGGVLIGHDLTGGKTSTSTSAASTNTAQQASETLSSSAISAIAAKSLPSVVEVKETTSSGGGIGSGVILSSDGEILTNNHVVSDVANGGGSLTVTFSNGKTAQASIVGTSVSSDLAVIKAHGVSGLTAAKLGDSSTVKVGDEVVAIGSPEGLQNTVTSGIVSYLNRKVTVQGEDPGSQNSPWGNESGFTDPSNTVSYNAIQTDAAINPGNSGGPLINAAGEVVGINSAIYSPASSDRSQGGNIGLGFAIPINQAKQIIAELESGAST